ncbi:MAG: hydroxymethylbilane synthase [Chlamydiales bacterium]
MKKPSVKFLIDVGARGSPLSRVQVEEVFRSLPGYDYVLHCVETAGDLDQKTPLRNLDKSDFFTREIDECLLNREFRIAIHSAKDLPDPLSEGLEIVALTKGVDSSDSLVLHGRVEDLPLGAKIGTSSSKREKNIEQLRSDLQTVDIRGTIEQRLALLMKREIAGVVIAEAALIRLGLTHLNRVKLPGETAPLQGRLAVVARTGDSEMRELFAPLNL